jgi:predicted membrane GTPase involved in stress response
MSDTRGTAIFNRVFHGYAPHKGEIQGRHTGVLLSNGTAMRWPMRCSTWKIAAR